MVEGATRILLGPGEGEKVELGGLGVRFMVDGGQSGGGFALVEHPIAPRTLAAPLHTHIHEDEYTYVLEGEVGVQVGDEVRYAIAGDLVFKPRGIAHAFWNRRDEPARALELISPAGFERFFAEAASLLPPHLPEPDFAALAALQQRYGLEMDFESAGAISAREGLDPS